MREKRAATAASLPVGLQADDHRDDRVRGIAAESKAEEKQSKSRNRNKVYGTFDWIWIEFDQSSARVCVRARKGFSVASQRLMKNGAPSVFGSSLCLLSESLRLRTAKAGRKPKVSISSLRSSSIGRPFFPILVNQPAPIVTAVAVAAKRNALQTSNWPQADQFNRDRSIGGGGDGSASHREKERTFFVRSFVCRAFNLRELREFVRP